MLAYLLSLVKGKVKVKTKVVVRKAKKKKKKFPKPLFPLIPVQFPRWDTRILMRESVSYGFDS